MDSSSRTPSPTTYDNDSPGAVFQLSDQAISQEIDFVEEIGNGNWGSVWLARPKRTKISRHAAFKDAGRKFAIKVVHRSKSAANASRLKSLWNEMKIVRTFQEDSHPSIISFHSFIIAPSFAMITMTYLPILIPVEVDEPKCKEWFRFLLSGVDFLHRRGVVHNDIKPANILLSHNSTPVLVDFGFAELNDVEDETTFHSNLTYGTPEYLSPERARGLTHDTRKSDVWSLGVTFFEILTGRTPFEEYDGDALQSKEDVEKYWSRTLRGKWIGKWNFSDKMEKLLRRMMSPNADLRCTAAQAMVDGYWVSKRDSQLHRRSESYVASIAFEKDLDKLLSMTPPKARPNPLPSQGDRDENIPSPPGLEPHPLRQSASHHSLTRVSSQPKIAINTASKVQPRKKVAPALDLSPIKGSPPASPAHRSAAAKENTQSRLNPNKDAAAKKARRPFGAVLAPENNMSVSVSHIPVRKLDEMTSKRRSGVFSELRKSHSNLNDSSLSSRNGAKNSNNVKDRVLEWEREKQRLREMERLEELERERDDHFQKEREKKEGREAKENPATDIREGRAVEPQEEEEAFMMVVKKDKKTAGNGQKSTPTKTHRRVKTNNKENIDKENVEPNQQHRKRPSSPPVLPLPPVMSPLSRMMNTFPAPTPNNTPAQAVVSPKQSKSNIFKHTIKSSIDKTLQFYKSSSLGRAASASTPTRGASFEITKEASLNERRISAQWKNHHGHDEVTPATSPLASPPANSPLSPLAPIKNAPMTHQMAADTQMDRMAIWMKNVEKVVEEAQANFESAAPKSEFKLPPLPVPPSQARAQRSGRLPRRVLAASQIFDENGAPCFTAESSFASGTPPSAYSRQISSNEGSSSAGYEQPASTVVSPTDSQFVIPEIVTPSRQRRATVSARSPIAGSSPPGVVEADSSFSGGLNPKSPGHMSLAQLKIIPNGQLDAETKRPQPSPKLSDVVDRNLFVAPAYTSRDNLLDIAKESSFDDEGHSSICHVEPYPQTRASQDQQGRYCDTPERQHMESIYDRFLMTSGVRRNGKGYQSDAPAASQTLGVSNGKKESNHRAFYSARKPMPPPVSSEDVERGAVSVDELGMMHHGGVEGEGAHMMMKDEGTSSTVALVRRAFKAMVPGKAVVSRRLSRAY